ncbi:MAG: hypothetical protein JWO58_797, partial [Chitinophagaceae bacterium]|nr:hypothetical protein [Chitinophagaceae bacterium]
MALFALMQTSFSIVYGQSPVGIGQWRVHYPYNSDARSLALVDDRVYCSNGLALFYYNKTDQSLNGISKKDGLTGLNITKLGSYKSKDLIIGYDDGNIDFVTGNAVSQFNDIQ